MGESRDMSGDDEFGSSNNGADTYADASSEEEGMEWEELSVDFGSDSEQLPDKVTYSISHPNPLCIKFNNLLSSGKISENGILYKHLNDVVESFIDPLHPYDKDVLEFFNTISYLGGRSTENFIRGPIQLGQGKDCNKKDGERLMNFGGPARKTRSKVKSGYTTKSGIIKDYSLCQLIFSTHEKEPSSFLVENDTVQVVPAVLSNDGNALKPAIEFDKTLNRNVGLNIQVDHKFVEENPSLTKSFLKSHIVTEAVISSVTTLDNASSMPCIAEYVPKAGKTGEALRDEFLANILTIQSCQRCQEHANTDEHILPTFEKLQCISKCERCIEQKAVCDECKLLGHEHYLPCLRACQKCVESNHRCVRRVILVLSADSEEGNKWAFKDIIRSIKDGTIDPHLFLLTVLPDGVHVGKKLKGSFANWMIVLGNERGCLGLLRTLRSRSSKTVINKMHELLPNADAVINRDRQDPSHVLAITNERLTTYLGSLGYVSSTIIPEMTKYTEDNKIGTYPKPIDVCVANHGFILVLFDFDGETGSCSLLIARLHSPVDNIKIIRKNIKAREVHYNNGVAYLAGPQSPVSVVEVRSECLQICKGKNRTKQAFKDKLAWLGLSTTGTAKVLKERLSDHISKTETFYKDKNVSKDLIQLNDYVLDAITINHTSSREIVAASSSHKCIVRVTLSFDGVGVSGQVTECVDYGNSWHRVRSLCLSGDTLHVSHQQGLTLLNAIHYNKEGELENNDERDFNRLAAYNGGVLISDSKTRKIWQLKIKKSKYHAFCRIGQKYP